MGGLPGAGINFRLHPTPRKRFRVRARVGPFCYGGPRCGSNPVQPRVAEALEKPADAGSIAAQGLTASNGE